ncbi:DUF6695 family protein [Flavobacterium maritimum]|uniref:DUF6695 family protein n=1 Tax=Flavobacterium maritimum TaxID=3149042 RepID=UPI0032B38776
MKNQKKTIPLFDNPLLERFSRTNAALAISTLVFISLGILAYGIFEGEIKIMVQMAVFTLGFLFFTLAEYLIHRFVFHSGEYMNTQKWQFKIHGIHHTTPQDKERLTLPIPLAIILSSLFFFLFWMIMRSHAFSFFPGFLLGYAFYLSVHYIIHTRKPPKNSFRFLWKHHNIHHYKNDHQAFGVTSPFWDIVFGTMPINKPKESFKMNLFNGTAIAIAWPEFTGKQPGSWYDEPMRWVGHNRDFQYKVGHAALVLVNNSTGSCYHFDCGRYHAPFQHGRIRDVSTDTNLTIHTKANFLDNKIANINHILTEIQGNESTFGMGPLYASYCPVNFDAAQSKIKALQNKDAIPFGPFVVNGINCCRFVRTAILAGNPAFKYSFKLRYLWFLKPMPINNINCLTDKMIVPECLSSETQKQNPHSHSPYTKENVKGTLPAPTKPENIPADSQWLGGEVVGGWFWMHPKEDNYIINRYSSEGKAECSGIFRLVGKVSFDAKLPYSFSHLSHCSKVTITQNGKVFRFLRNE